jgi:hypothetical protein
VVVRRPDDDNQEAAVEELSGGDARAQRGEKSRERCSEDRGGGHGPFIGGRREVGAEAS